jgi:xanthine dehydrogenase accessory factor
MDSADHEVLRAAAAWLDAGHGVSLITIARTWGSAPRPAGALAAVRADGRLTGSVSGGCIEEQLIERLVAQPPAVGRPEVISYGVTREEAGRLGLPCGGRLELVLEALAEAATLRPLLTALAQRQLLERRLHLASGQVSLHTADRDQPFHYDGAVLAKVYGPTWRLLLIGANQLSRYLAEMARALDYEVIVCDPRREQVADWPAPAGVTVDHRMPDDAVLALADDPRSAVVTLTHDPRLDDLALLVALDSRAGYVGALGSQRSQARRRPRLRELGVSATGLARLHGPVGLPIGSRTPPEIAVAILAELIAARQGVALPLGVTATAIAAADSPGCAA